MKPPVRHPNSLASTSYLDLKLAPYVLYGVKYIDLVSLTRKKHGASDSHHDLGRAPYVLYGVKYIDLVSLTLKKHGASDSHHDLSRALHGLYGVKCIDPVSLALFHEDGSGDPYLALIRAPPFFLRR